MVETFQIRYDRTFPSAERVARFFDFGVTADDESHRWVRVVVPLPCDPEAVLPLAFERLELELSTLGSGLFAAGEEITEIKIVGEPEELLNLRSKQKACVWQVRGRREWTCLAHVGEGEPATSPSLLRGLSSAGWESGLRSPYEAWNSTPPWSRHGTGA